MRSRFSLLAAAIAIASWASTADAQPPKPKPAAPAKPAPPKPKPPPQPTESPSTISVTVTELAGGQAYVKPGSSGGVHRGSKVVIGKKEYPVIQTTASFAVIELGHDTVHEQDKGEASIVGEEEEKPRELPKPHALATWEGAWPAAAEPASAQAPPRYVPLGGGERDRRFDVRLTVGAGTIVPLGRGTPITRMALNARVHAEPIRTAPLAIDADVSLQKWLAGNLDARDGAPARPLVWVRELLVGYGGAGRFYAGLGRMRYAASTLGTLDGLRLTTPLGGGFSVGAFGGVLPHPMSGAPSLDAQRFGVETAYSRPDVALRPEAALVLHGSTFDGKLDERRVSGVVGIYPGRSRFGGHFELSNFSSDNPWNASSLELTAAGADGSVRFGPLQLGARFDLRQPVRSRWLASFMPVSWFCRAVPAPAGSPPGSPDACDGSVSTRALGAVDAGVEIGMVSFTVGGTMIRDLTQSGGAPDMRGGFVTGRVVHIARIARLEASGSYSNATYLQMLAASGGPGLTLFSDALDISTYYRYAQLQYRAIDTSLTQHGIGGAAMLFPTSSLVFTLQSEAIVGDDAEALLVFGTLMWRPRF